jgi:DNA ligase-1
MTNDLIQLANFIDEMKATSSTNSKKEILKRYGTPFMLKLFKYVYSPFKQYGVSSDNLKKNRTLSADVYSDLFTMLDDLNERRITGHTAITAVNGFIEKYSEFSDIIYDVIDRNIKTRATGSLINNVYPKTVPVFDVALAQKFRDHVKKVKFESRLWLASRKLDGLRCITIFDLDGGIRFFSRSGKEFFTLDVLKADLQKLNLKGKVFDGEICIMQDNGIEDFQGILKEARLKGHTIEHPMYQIFDFLELSEFEAGEGEVTLVARQIMLNALFLADLDENKMLLQELNLLPITHAKVLPQIVIENQEHFDELVADAELNGYEGIMVRKNVGYEGKRTHNLLKVKQMDDAEYLVVGYEVGMNRIIEDGVEIEEEMLKNVHILEQGDPVNVGSGFSLAQRRQFYKNPEEIVGKIITVQFFEKTQDQTGKHSLRFPVIKSIYDNERED